MVGLSVEGEVPGVDPERLETDAEALLALVGLPDAELSVVLCDDAFIRPLNAEWRGKDQPTDVLSFPQDDDVVLGDVIISVETATRQAAELGHPVEHEVRALLVHGLLHLLGHDHHDPAEAAEMRAEEEKLLVGLGLVGAAGLVGRSLES